MTTSTTILAALLARHPTVRQEWAVFRELATATGGGARTIDLFALNCWRSGGFRSVAYEVKVDRGDFKREIADPTKREPAEKLAGECYFATPPGLVRPDEVPEGWGLIECSDAGTKVRKVATQRRVESWPMSFCAALARRSCDPAPPWPLGLWRYEGREVTAEQLVAETGKAVEDIERRVRSRLRGDVRLEVQREYAQVQAVYDAVAGVVGWPCTAEKVLALLESKVAVSPFVRREVGRSLDLLTHHLRKVGVLAEETKADAAPSLSLEIGLDGGGL